MVGKTKLQCSLNLSLNPVCGNSTGSNQIEKENVAYLLDLFGGTREKRQCDLMCGVPLDDWANPGLC